ncbi:MAG: hypothetical protein H0U53_08650 [Actinobacteria bacterium]|nr:hypothetical protein [Actinomycetota bacterium]
MRLKSISRIFLVLALAASALISVPAQAGHDDADHSDNLRLLAQKKVVVSPDDPTTEDANEEILGEASDMAFKGKTLIAGAFQGLSLFKILPKSEGYLKQISFFPCAGGQGDVSVHGDLVIFSVDSPRVGPTCSPEDTAPASQAQFQSGAFWEGIRIISIADPERPKLIGHVQLRCGSHTNTLLPKGENLYVYVQSYPIAQSGSCTTVSDQNVKIVKIPLNDPAKAEHVADLKSPADGVGCHDISVFPSRDLAVAACLGTSLTLDISDPVKPETLGIIRNEQIELDHSSAITWDGKYAILGDEHAGAAGGGGCSESADSPVGAAWFYDISGDKVKAPELLSSHSLPRIPVADTPAEVERFRCTTHNFNILPMKDPKKYIAVVAYYMGGIAAIDFSDPENPEEIAHYQQAPDGVATDTWSAYWYNNRIYTTDYLSKLGIGVYKLNGTGKRKVFNFKGGLNPQVQLTNTLFDAARR